MYVHKRMVMTFKNGLICKGQLTFLRLFEGACTEGYFNPIKARKIISDKQQPSVTFKRIVVCCDLCKQSLKWLLILFSQPFSQAPWPFEYP